MLVWIDLETTGLDPERHALLEVACIITDDALNEVARFESVIGLPVNGDGRPVQFHETDEFVRNMHTANGLWDDIRKAFGSRCQGMFNSGDYSDLSAVDCRLAGLIRTHAVRVVTDEKGRKSVERPQLAGSTISFDRAFMKKYLPRAEAELHYRSVDVSSLTELAKRFWPAVYEGRPKSDSTHRAMPDIKHSVDLLRYYVGALCRIG